MDLHRSTLDLPAKGELYEDMSRGIRGKKAVRDRRIGSEP
jgi:hypothetical protein